MFNGTQKDLNVNTPPLKDISSLIISGGFPSNLKVERELSNLLPISYIEAILDKDINDDKRRDKMKMLLKSLARNESTIASNQTLLKDIEEFLDNESILEGRNTVSDYLDVLTRLYVIC